MKWKTVMDRRPVLLWAIAHWKQGIYSETVRRTRKEAIDAFMERYARASSSWRSESQYGVHQAVKITAEVWDGK